MSNPLRRTASAPRSFGFSSLPSAKGVIVANPSVGNFIKSSLSLLNLPDSITWDGKIVAVLNVSPDVGEYLPYSFSHSAKGNGRYEFKTVPSNEFWYLYAWWVQAVNCDVTDVKMKVFGDTAYGVPLTTTNIVGAGGSAEDGAILGMPLPCPAGSKFSFMEANDAGADIVSTALFYKRVLVQ